MTSNAAAVAALDTTSAETMDLPDVSPFTKGQVTYTAS